MPHPDGIWDGSNTIQGVRSYDGAIAAWTTPDAYKGDVHDPMSQQSYMWNRNNPFTYADPTGFDTVLIFDSQKQTLRVIGVTGTSDNGIDKTFKAANNVTKPRGDPMTPKSNGHMPDGMFNLGPMSANTTKTDIASMGPIGFFPLTDHAVGPDGRGLGIHSGRASFESLTEGCIRTTDEAMKFLQEHRPVFLEVNQYFGGAGRPVASP
jgi:hypothetical protein